MAFTAADVKKLREMTSVGMMDCKKALTEADGNFDKAIELLREKGLAKAAKKASSCSPCLPSRTALAMVWEMSLIARIASSLPGIT